MISTSAVDAYIEKNSQRFVDELKELCAFPSISNHGRDALGPAREWIAGRLSRFTDRVETLDAGGMLLSDDVDVTVNIEAAKSAAAVKDEVKKEKSE